LADATVLRRAQAAPAGLPASPVLLATAHPETIILLIEQQGIWS
jgi:hypothetical protein